MKQQPRIIQKRLTPVNLRSRGGSSWKATPNSHVAQTPTRPRQPNIKLIIDESDYSDLSSSDEKIEVVKVANKKSPTSLLSDYSCYDYSDHGAEKTKLVKSQQEKADINQQNYSSYSDSSSIPSKKSNARPNNIKKNPSNEINFTPPQTNQNQEIIQVQKSRFVRPNIRNVNQSPSIQSSEKVNDQFDPVSPNLINDESNQAPHRQRKKRRIVKSNNQAQNQNQYNSIQQNQNDSNTNNNANNNSDIENSNNNGNETININTQNNALSSNIVGNSTYDPNLPFQHFIVTKELGKFHKLKTHLFTDKSKIYIHSKDKKTVDRKQIHYFVGEKEIATQPESQRKKRFRTFSFNDAIATLKWNKAITRFTLYTNKTKDFRDDRLGELLGVYVDTNSNHIDVHHGDSTTNSYLIFTVVIPKNQCAYYPVSERMTLAELAKGEDENRKLLKKFSSTPSKKNKEKKNNESENEMSEINLGSTHERNFASADINHTQNTSAIDPRFMRLVQADLEKIPQEELGNIFYQKSNKNFAFVDEATGNPIFMLFRSSKNSFSIKVRPPMLPLQAHALAVVILKRNMQWQLV